MAHQQWLWMWMTVGASLYWIKRAFYMITGPTAAASTIPQFIRVAGVPILFRWAVDSGLFWVLFSQQLVSQGLKAMGWSTWAWAAMMVTQFAPMAFFFGLGVDPMVDWFIPTVIGRVPFLKDWWPQMPAPLVKQDPPPPGV